MDLPTVELPDPPPPPLYPTIWISSDAVWLRADDQSSPTRIVELASVEASPPGVVEPLAEALYAAIDKEDAMLFDPSVVGLDVIVRADAATRVGTLRRVLTTARATGYRQIRYVSDHGSIQLDADVPVRPDPVFDQALVVGQTTEGGLMLNGQPMLEKELREQVERITRTRVARCVYLDMDEKRRYADWLALIAQIAGPDLECVTIPSPAVPADQALQPPPPPPPSDRDGATAPVPPPTPELEADGSRVEHWWTRSLAVSEDTLNTACTEALAPLQKIPEAELTEGQLRSLTGLEGNCGTPERVDALRVLRTERFPDDWRGWYELGVARFGPLFPDPESGLPYREKMDPVARRAVASSALEALQRAQELAPKQRDPHVWAAMAHTQLALAWEIEDSPEAEIRARVERMRAWQAQQAVCGESMDLGCPPAPYLPEEFEADLADLGE